MHITLQPDDRFCKSLARLHETVPHPRLHDSANSVTDAALSVPDFKKRPIVVHDICSTMLRFNASSTKAARVQCDKCAGGTSHAKAIIWQTCSDVKTGAMPGRGASANSDSMASPNALGFPSHAISCAQPDSQRFRHFPAFSS
ncbi:MAG: hypothetical protein Q8N32_03370 [Sulfuricurvum sp.]|nr:hypothetical protein [Sulfuricurvum sp.]